MSTSRCDRILAQEGRMGILDFVKKQFIDIIEWTERDDDVLA